MRKRWKIILWTTAGGALLLVGGLRLALDDIAIRVTESVLHDQFGIDVAIEDLAISLSSGHVKLTGLRVTERGSPLLEAAEIEVSTSLRDIASGNYDFHTLTIRRPIIRVAIEEGGGLNFARIFGPRESAEVEGKPAEPPPAEEPAGPGPVVRFRDARIEGGWISFDDKFTDDEKPARIVLDQLEIRVGELQVSGARRSDEFLDLRIDSLLAQDPVPARLSVCFWSPPTEGKPTYALHSAITGLDLRGLKPYVSGSASSALGGDFLHVVGTLIAVDGAILSGGVAAHVVETDDDLTLKIGGTTSELVFDDKSALSSLINLPFARLGHAGDVALASAAGATMNVGKGVYGAGGAVVGGVGGTLKGVAHADPLGALGAAGGGVVGGVKQLGQGVFGGVARLFGRGGDKQPSADRDAEFAKLHAHWRAKMLEAAMLSAKDGTSERRARIESEIAAEVQRAEQAAAPKPEEQAADSKGDENAADPKAEEKAADSKGE